MLRPSGGGEGDAQGRRALLRRLLERKAAAESSGLSVEQERLWVSNQRDPGDPSQNIRTAIWIRGPFDLGVFEDSVNRLVSRHAQLRARFRAQDGRPHVDIAPVASLPIEVVDLRSAPVHVGDEGNRGLEDLIRAEASKPFELAVGPPLRIALFVVGDEERVAVLSVHHIVFDRRSMDILLHELCDLYDAGVAGRSVHLPEIERSYQDFARGQAEALEGSAGAAMSEFWREELDGYAGDATNWFEAAGGGAPSTACDVRSTTFSADVSRRVVERAASLRATPFMVLVAALGLLLRRVGAGEDLIVATPTANREDEAWESLIGNFVNLLPLRIRPGAEESLETWVPTVRRTVLSAHRHQQLPLHRIAQAAGLRPAKLLTLFFQHDAGAVAPRVAGGASFDPQPIDLGTSHHVLAVSTHYDGERLAASLRYRIGTLEPDAAESLLADLESVLDQVTSDPRAALGDLRVTTALAPPEPAVRAGSPASVREPASGEEDAAGDLTTTERFLTELWRELLDVPDVSPWDNFLDVGGDSLLAMQVIERVEESLGVRLVPAELFTQTLAQIAASCEARSA